MRLRLITLAVLWMISACGQQQATRPNLLLITLDTLRADRLGCYGYAEAQTPTLDALAAGGLLFEQCMTTYPLTLPAHASMLTGHTPLAHGSHGNNQVPTPQVPTVAQALQDAGYSTAAVVSAFVLDSQFGLDRGFDHYDDDLGQGDEGINPEIECRGEWTTTRALRWLEQQQDAPFFLWVHYFDPHAPYAAPAPHARGYDGEITYVDEQIQTLLASLGSRRDDTAVVIVGDHGEAFGEHDEWEHGLLLYETTLRVPLIVSAPAIASGRVTEPVSVTDIAATLLDLAGVQTDAPAPAPSLLEVARGQGTDRQLYAETQVPLDNHGASPLRALRQGNWKWIDAPRPELFDLANDASEQHNLFTAEAERSDEMRRALEDLSEAQVAAPGTRMSDAETAQKLAALGYVSSGQTRGPDLRVDPKDVARALAIIRQGDRAQARGERSVAEEHYREALTQLPGDWKATWKLAFLLREQGDLNGALEVYAATCEADPGNLSAAYQLGLLQLEMRDWDGARVSLARVVDRDPRNVAARLRLAVALWESQQHEPALQHVRRVLEIEPDNEAAAQFLARAEAARKP